MAYNNLVLPISVVEAAKQVQVPITNNTSPTGPTLPLYYAPPPKPDGTPGQDVLLPEQNLITVGPDGKESTHLMAQIPLGDIKIFLDELDVALRLENPFAQNLFARNVKQLAHLIRAVNKFTTSGFKGSVGSGNQLDAVMLRAEQHADPDLSIAAPFAFRTSWIRAINAAASPQFICQPDNLGANNHGPLTMANNEAYALLGFANPAAGPCTSAYQLQYLGVTFNIQNLAFELVNPRYGDPIVELKQPLFIYPGENGLVTVRYFTNGSDELRPIGLWIKTATNLRALATS